MTRNENGIIIDVTNEDIMIWQEMDRYLNGLDVQEEYKNMFNKECPYDIETSQKIGSRAIEILDKDESYWEDYLSAFQAAINEAEEKNR